MTVFHGHLQTEEEEGGSRRREEKEEGHQDAVRPTSSVLGPLNARIIQDVVLRNSPKFTAQPSGSPDAIKKGI